MTLRNLPIRPNQGGPENDRYRGDYDAQRGGWYPPQKNPDPKPTQPAQQ